jgi:hypothetical protein
MLFPSISQGVVTLLQLWLNLQPVSFQDQASGSPSAIKTASSSSSSDYIYTFTGAEVGTVSRFTKLSPPNI